MWSNILQRGCFNLKTDKNRLLCCPNSGVIASQNPCDAVQDLNSTHIIDSVKVPVHVLWCRKLCFQDRCERRLQIGLNGPRYRTQLELKRLYIGIFGYILMSIKTVIYYLAFLLDFPYVVSFWLYPFEIWTRYMRHPVIKNVDCSYFRSAENKMLLSCFIHFLLRFYILIFFGIILLIILFNAFDF